MKIALLGTRGIPAAHGGFETCVEEIGVRFVNMGHSVTVYSKKKGKPLHIYKGMQIVYIPRIPIKGFETLFATMLGVLHSLIFKKFDFHMVFDNANAPALLFYKILNKRYSINTDGLGWQRDKWGTFAKKYYKWSEFACAKLSKNIITDSLEMQKYYKSEYGADSTVIAYGANIPFLLDKSRTEEILKSYGLNKHNYVLQVTRFEPENNPLLSIEAFQLIKNDKIKLVLVGGVPTSTKYSEAMCLEAAKNPNVMLPGFIYDRTILDTIWVNCLCYIHGNQIGGTNPALLQAMIASRPVIARDCVFNREVLQEFGFFYERNTESLKVQLESILTNVNDAEKKAAKAYERVRNEYDWDKVASKYERYFIKYSR